MSAVPGIFVGVGHSLLLLLVLEAGVVYKVREGVVIAGDEVELFLSSYNVESLLCVGQNLDPSQRLCSLQKVQKAAPQTRLPSIMYFPSASSFVQRWRVSTHVPVFNHILSQETVGRAPLASRHIMDGVMLKLLMYESSIIVLASSDSEGREDECDVICGVFYVSLVSASSQVVSK